MENKKHLLTIEHQLCPRNIHSDIFYKHLFFQSPIIYHKPANLIKLSKFVAANNKIRGVQLFVIQYLQNFIGQFQDQSYSYAITFSFLAIRFRKLFNFSEKNRFFRTFNVHFLLVPENRRSLFLKPCLRKVTKVFIAKKNPTLEKFLTMAIFKILNF